MIRTGIGYDVHQLAIGKKLIIAGVTIPAPFGSVGHSDGDVLIHALVDALLGAASLGDIGTHFPSKSGKWSGVSSNHFLVESVKIVEKSGFEICNVDTTIILQKPKIKRFIPQIKNNLTDYMNIDESGISVKTTTTDYLGFIGDGNGWAALAVATLFK
ncbi:MAG: 2-C-methyl-D-erythritol 2,4-cyclodiphosphate synthase [Candidatus Marinimicrobia bacterium]|nr:2-C-methyl-D-erythritol 2,4-cyclodiphosphate synthase [Candidatus Neomarinimicrobiota bacterium]|tara:strand:- start:884 stop:1357 length:474 start_codon:yes stop_codon:yes gene_type:complete